MVVASRIVLPEELDGLPPSDPRALRSRRDLQRVHRVMCSVTILNGLVRQLRLLTPPRRIIELGAGDASLLLRVARSFAPPWPGVSVTVLDRHDMVSPETRAAYESLGWELTVLREDACAWATSRDAPPYDLCIASLFLHHFDGEALASLLQGISARANAFIALEPRRSLMARAGSRLIGVLGAGPVTREDSVKSVAAGFRGKELTALWPAAHEAWWCAENAAFPFAHGFAAARQCVREP